MNDEDKEAFEKWWSNLKQPLGGCRKGYKKGSKDGWQAACDYKQKELDELRLQYDKLTDWASEYVAENAKLNQEIEKFKGYLEAWGKDE